MFTIQSVFSAILMLIVGLAVGLIILLLLLTKKRPKDSPPTANIGIPFIGNYIEFAKNPVKFIETGYKNYGNIYTVQMLHKNLTFLLGPEASQPFFALPDDKMSQSEVYGFMTPVFGKNIVYDAEPKRRAQQMQCVGQGLRSLRLKAYVPKIEKETLDYLRERWNPSSGTGVINLLDALSELTILTSSRCLHGDDVRENLFAEVSKIYHDLDKGVTPISFFFPYAPIEAHRRRDEARKEMVEIFSKVIRQRKQSGDTQETRTDILQMYIDFRYKDDGSALTDEEIVGLLIALLFAGQHTSSITSTWTAMLLIHHPDELQKVLIEQEKVFGNKLENISENHVDADQLASMECLQNAAKEALRMFPPLIMLMRQALDDISVTVDGAPYLIPKGDIVFTSPAVSSRIASLFPNPESFIPDRFNDTAQAAAFIGFGAGRHQCLGQQFGLLQVKTILSVIFRNYKLEPMEKLVPEPDYTAMVVGPKNRLMVRFTKLPNSAI
jgi:sterol 14-demethylase